MRRDVRLRFTGSALGIAWAVLQPLSLITLYWFVFTVMIPRAVSADQGGYVEYLITGLLPWLAFNEGLMRATTSIVDNGAMVRRLPLKSEILVIVPNATALLFQLVSLALFSGVLLASGFSVRNYWILPLALGCQFALQLGLSWFLATVHVFFRDLVQLLGFFLSILFYLSPILYEVPAKFADVFRWNPLTPLLGIFRYALVSGPIPTGESIVFLLVSALATFALGLLFFRRARGTLTDLI